MRYEKTPHPIPSAHNVTRPHTWRTGKDRPALSTGAASPDSAWRRCEADPCWLAHAQVVDNGDERDGSDLGPPPAKPSNVSASNNPRLAHAAASDPSNTGHDKDKATSE